MSAPSQRLLHIDTLKALAAQLIVLHHLSVYGPISDAVHASLPGLIDALFQYGRMAVQVFLVVGGYLSARALSARGGLLSGSPAELLWRRYLRLVLPFMAAIALSLASAALVAPWLPEFEPSLPSLGALLSHALLLHGVLGQESLTVGAWYVAIDFQLFACLLGLLWLARRASGLPRTWRMVLGPVLVLLLCTASMFFFNHNAEWQDLAPYFFGAYGLGAMVHWMGLSRRPRLGLALLLALGALALLLGWRERLALALLTAALLGVWQWQGGAIRSSATAVLARLVAHLGTHSYSLFLVHFPVCLMVNAWFAQHAPMPAWASVMALLAAWLLSNMAAQPFHRWIEAPSSRLRFNPLAWLAPQGSPTR
ncbi:acyltransferase [Paucibacter sp. APW11]|uniref:Acyltransferase n=1 Tax=Roseateles aquae TaxID=3077235 RepID=A0ABU3PC77_9BURK|nr:acyltransferase [Paucibacter sp. APW11]MDT9000169.1 acyltransferase [Paucibacter sp. APW11]